MTPKRCPKCGQKMQADMRAGMKYTINLFLTRQQITDTLTLDTRTDDDAR